MKVFSIIAVLFATTVTFAQQLPLFPDEEIQIHLDSLLKTGCDRIHNGDCGITEYDPATFDYGATLEDLIQKHHDPDSYYVYEHDLRWRDILSNWYMYESGVSHELQYFLDNGLVQAMYAFYPNEDQCNESEYCSLYNVFIYLTTGHLIYLYFDFTT